MAVRSRAESPGFGSIGETPMPFRSLPHALLLRESTKRKHFLAIGKDRDTLIAVEEIYDGGVRFGVYSLGEKGKLKREDIVAPQGQDIPISNNRLIRCLGINGQAVSVVFRSPEPMPEPLMRQGDKPIRILKRLKRRHDRWERSRKN